ncbi:Highly reducing polyketide synthase ACRTS2 [Colletotrichum sp. SAR 10_66]|nr:Highly reducing polyketide synthase ACRTS2 [Colletotrichum sp. SAR 10_66]
MKTSTSPPVPIAVIGVAYRAPGVGRKGLFDFLSEARSAFSRVPKDRFDHESFHYNDSAKPGALSAKGAYFLPDDIYAFDAPFFNITAEEAVSMDPQIHVVLKLASESHQPQTKTNAPYRLSGSKTGVFSAQEEAEYGQQMIEDLPTSTKYCITGNAGCMVSNRLSYFFNLRGPSISLDSACSSSGYAVHMACQSLRAGECETAFVGASSLMVNHHTMSQLDTLGALSSDGKCFSYDSRANGFGRGEGASCLILKRLDQAIEAGDPVHAVIRNSAANHSGRTRGITLPSQVAQEELLWRVHQEVGLKPAETDVVEGHGTGTPVGDPIDASAAANVIGRDREGRKVYLGSLKSNFGHLHSASGLLSVIKATMMVRLGTIFPNAEFETINPKIDSSRLEVVRRPTPWISPESRPRRAVVTNFGFGGSNAAVLIEEYKTNEGPSPSSSSLTTTSEPSQMLFPISAQSLASLSSYQPQLASHLEKVSVDNSSSYLGDLGYTLGLRRTHFTHRMALVAGSLSELREQLVSPSLSSTGGRVAAGQKTAPCFVFTGQGAQAARMAAGLGPQYPVFAKAMEDAEKHLRAFGATWSLAEELAKSEGSRINEAEISQPACTAVQLGLVELLRSWGISPMAVVGHSSGEIAAAYAAGLLSFKTALAVAFFRGRSTVELLAKQAENGGEGGGMLAVGADVNTASELLRHTASVGRAGIAAINSPNSVTLSGDVAVIDAVERIANAQGIFNRRLRVNVAYHSHHMERVASSYVAAIEPYCAEDCKSRLALNGDYEKKRGSVPLFSSVTGQVEGAETITAAQYWAKNLVSPVRFSEAITLVANESSANVLVETGPHAALKGPINQTLQSLEQKKDSITYVPSLVRGTDDAKAVLHLAGRLYAMGLTVDFHAINGTEPKNGHRVLADLPSYEWDKKARFIHRSPVSVGKFHSGHTFTPLLGWKMASQGRDHVFRQVFTLDELPWVRDHKVVGDVLFPFTGFLSLAVDAFRSITTGDAAASFSICEMHIERGLHIKEEQRVDICTKLRPVETGTGHLSSSTWAFEVMTWSEQTGWVTHVHGRIEAGSEGEKCLGASESPVWQAAEKILQGVNAGELNEATALSGYDTLDRSGVCYGSSFKNIFEMWRSPGQTVHRTLLRQTNDEEPLSIPKRGSAMTVDPPMLDSVLSSALLAVGDGLPEPRPAFVPTYVRRMQLSNTIPCEPGQLFTTVSHRKTFQEKTGRSDVSIVVWTDDPQGSNKRVPCVEMELTYQRINDAGQEGEEQVKQTLPRGYQEVLVPHVDLSDNKILSESIMDRSWTPEELLPRHKHNAVGRHFLKRAIQVAAGLDETTLPKHLKAFLAWAEVQVRGVDDEPEAGAELLQEVARDDAFGELICAVGNAIPEILRGEVEPLEVMMKDGLLMKHYDDIRTMARGNQALARYIANLGELNPDLRIIEVGAGTGAATTKVLQALSAEEPEEEDNFSAYTYTDISPGFFDAARKKLARWPQVTYTKLDISQDPAEQGIEVGTYDVVIASNVLHATQDIEETVRNIGSLLRPGTGKLAIVESLPESCDAAFLPYTILPGWWLTEDSWRQGNDGPLMSQETWDRLLVTLGFNGVEGAVADWPGADVCIVKTMWSTKLSDDIQDEEEESDAAGEVMICGTITEEQQQLAGAVQSKLEHLQSQIIKSVSETQQISDKFCIFLDCGKTSFLADIATEEAFAALRAMVLDTRGLLWVTPDSDSPEFARVQGLLRTLRLEDPTKKLLWFSKAPTSDPAQTAGLVDKLTGRLVKDSSSSPADLLEQDFVWQDGMFQVPRLRRLPETTRTFAIEKGLPVRREQNLWEGSNPNSALFMTMDTPGVMDSVYFKRHDLMSPAERPLGDDEIIVKVDACGINFRDVLALLNTIPWSLPGREGAGTVVAAGANVAHVRPGDSVFYMIAQGGLATHVRIPAAHACKLPSGLSPAEAASMAVAYVTALVCLDDVARLRPGESVLIHAASGAVGQACVRIAQSMGATVFATAGSEEKRTFVYETLGVPLEHIYSSRKRGFAAGILNVTGGRGVDVVVNSLSGELLQDTWSIVTEFGRFVEIGKKDILANSHLGMRQFERNVSFFAVDLVPYLSHKSDSIQACLAKMVSLFEAKVIQPIQPIHEVPVSDIVSGFRALQSGQNIGKIVAIMGKDDRVMADVASPLRRDDGNALLRSDATYLITGGTGGIGKSLVPWMLENGASNVVVLGRSATTNTEVAKLVSEYDSPSTGVHVRAVASDVSSRDSLLAALEAVRDLPSVKGVIHGSMYLRDSIFFNASFDDWKAINGPKIDAAWNLHHLLPDLDFFVALASGANVVGNVGQSIYCQTSSFLDAFAQWRSHTGKPTISISLPVVDDVGYVIQQGMREQLLEKLGFYISIAQVHTVIKGAIIGPSSGLNIDSRAIAFVLYDSPQGKSHGLEERSRYLSALRQKQWRKNKHALDGQGDAEGAAGGELSLLDALAGKVSSITMMSREDVTPTRSLIEYGLDSLVSVELRNWIKREYGADLALTQIVGAPDLQALADVIVARQKA